jgi:nitrite reductase/ring-hydroxylating ferredoxin subunit
VVTVSRRAVVAGAGAGAAVAAVGGCTTYGTLPTKASSPSSGTLSPVAQIPVGGGKIFADQQVVVTQPTAGDIRCFSAVCTHLGCIVGQIAGGTIDCPCHGSQFRITDGGVARGPATRPLAAKRITVAGGLIKLG